MTEVPEGWVEVELGEVWCESRARVQPNAIAPTKYLSLEHVEGGMNRITGHGSSEAVKSTVAVFSSGDVLYGRLRPYLNKVVRPSEAGVASTEFLVFEESPALSNALLVHLLSSTDLVAYASANSAGVNLPRVSAQRLGEYRFHLAPLPEQHRIVAKIEDLFAKLDAGVAALKRAEANLERYRASVLKAAVEGRLTGQWRKVNPPDETGEELLKQILAERRRRWEEEQLAKFEAKGKKPPKNWKKQYKEPRASDTNDLSKLPEGWCWASLGQVADFQNGRAFPSKEYADSGVRLLRPGNLHSSGRVNWSEKNTRHMPEEWAERFPQYIVGSDELVMNLTAQSLKDEFLGRVVETAPNERCLLNQRLARITSFPGLNRRFLLAVLRAWRFRHFVATLNSGSLIQHMFTSQLHEFVFPLPPQSEQHIVVAELDRLLTDCSACDAALDYGLGTRSSLRQSILKRAFQGRLVPQDPDDEPASVLLESVRAEHEAAGHRRKGRPTKPRCQPKTRVT